MKNRKMIVLTAAIMASTMLFTACGSKTEETVESTVAETTVEATEESSEEVTVEEATTTEEATTEETTTEDATEVEAVEAATTISIDMFSCDALGDMVSSVEGIADEFTVDFLFDAEGTCVGTEVVMVLSSSLGKDEKEAGIKQIESAYGDCRIDGDTIVFDGESLMGLNTDSLKALTPELTKSTYESMGFTVTEK